MANLTVGDRVLHHGRYHTLTALNTERNRAYFENESYGVACALSDLTWDDALGAWYLPGRLLSKNERAVIEAVTGAWPQAGAHRSLLPVLDNIELETVDKTRLKEVLLQRKQDVHEKIEAETLGMDDEAAVEAAIAAVLNDYTDSALEQVAVLRAARRA